MSYSVDPTIVMNDFINHVENWKYTYDYKKRKFVAFASFMKSLYQFSNTWDTLRTNRAQHL